MKNEIKQAFKNDTIDSLQAWDMERGYAHFLTQDFKLFVVETEMGRKGFKTFDGAFNKFIKMSKGFEMTIVDNDGDTVDLEQFMMEVEK